MFVQNAEYIFLNFVKKIHNRLKVNIEGNPVPFVFYVVFEPCCPGKLITCNTLYSKIILNK